MYFLYIKQHQKTKLKYFGKTDCTDPVKYKGSGVLWTSHIKEYGEDLVETIEIFEFDSKEERQIFATNFSKENNIVESTEWANLKPETGKAGGGGFKQSNEAKLKISAKNKGLKRSDEFRNKMSNLKRGIVLSDDHKFKIGLKSKNRPQSEEQRLKKSLKMKNKLWYNNGVNNIRLDKDLSLKLIPQGFVIGKI